MKSIHIAASREYDVLIETGLLSQLGTLAARQLPGRRAALISDDAVFPLYGQQAEQSLQDAGFQTEHFIFPHGEQHKTLATYGRALNFLCDRRFTREDVIIALGGGVVGDLAGFTAATYQRGVAYIQVPTTLLSMVDSSVGGKTAVDLPEGKNLVGTFTQPHLVLCDTNVLATLSPQVEAEGWAEIIKYGMIRSQELINFLLENTPGTDIEWVIAHCVSIKRDVVAQDEQDNAVRQVLNFGHTIGHAIERCSGYSLYHGEGVAMGMAIMTRACVRQKKCPPACWTVLETLLDKYHLPKTTDKSVDELLEAAHADKKRRGDAITLIQPEVLGRCGLYSTNYDELRRVLELGMPL